MTPDQFATEYLRREKAANKTPQGADHAGILNALAKEAGIPIEDARSIIHEHAFAGPC